MLILNSNIMMMDRIAIHEQIADLTDKITYLNKKLSGEQKIHPVEVDLLSSYARELQKLVEDLNKIKTELKIVSNTNNSAEKEKRLSDPEVEQKVKDEIKLHQHILSTVDNVDELNEAGKQSDKAAESKITKSASSENKETKQHHTTEELPLKSKSEAKLHITGKESSINDRFKKESTALADKLTSTKKKALKDTFGLNERYAIIDKLFNGSSEQFNSALHELTKCNNRKDAETIIAGIEEKYSWNKNEVFAKKFKEQVLQAIE